MLRKFIVAGCLGAFVLSLAACSSGDPKEVKMGEKQTIEDHKAKVGEDPAASGVNKPVQLTD